MGSNKPQFEERPRKVHFYHDQKGAKIPHSNKPFGNTLCKINSNAPEMLTTNMPHSVTCKLCRSHRDFKKYEPPLLDDIEFPRVTGREQAERITKHILNQQFGRALRPPRTRYRRNWRGKLILQVEYSYNNADHRDPLDFGQTFMRWRDATLEDLDLGVV